MTIKHAFKTCFISAPFNVDIAPLRNLLQERVLQVHDALSAPSGTGTISSSIAAVIRDSDFICAVLTPESRDNISFEIGFAAGCRKPIFLVVDENVEIPVLLQDIFYLRASPSQVDTIEFNLDNFLEHAGKTTRRAHRTIREPLISQPDPRLDKMESLWEFSPSERAQKLESLIADLFRESGAVVSHETRLGDVGVDMAVWLNDIESSLGNPVLVEIKVGKISEGQLKVAEAKLREYLNRTNARVGVVIYLDQDGRRFSSSPNRFPLIIRLDARDAAGLLSENGFSRVLISERNKVAHGAI